MALLAKLAYLDPYLRLSLLLAMALAQG